MVRMQRSQRTGLLTWSTMPAEDVAAVVDHGAVGGWKQAGAGSWVVTARARLPQRVDRRLHVVGVERPGDLQRAQAGALGRVGLQGGELLERAGGDDLARRVDVRRREAVLVERRPAPGRGRRRGPPSCRSAVAAAAAAMAWPRSRTKTIACSAVMTPAAVGRGDLADGVPGAGTDLAVGVGGVREEGEQRDQARRPRAAAGRWRCRGWSRRRLRCRAGRGRCRRTAESQCRRSRNPGSSSQGERKPGVWAPCPGATMTSTSPPCRTYGRVTGSGAERRSRTDLVGILQERSRRPRVRATRRVKAPRGSVGLTPVTSAIRRSR